MSEKIKLLKQWIKDEICRFGHFDDVVKTIGESGSPDEHTFIFRLYTDNYQYHIRAIDRRSEGGYLGCTSKCRKIRAGEDWTRGRDLADGKFTRETWEKIKGDIISYELVALTKPHEAKAIPPTNEEKSTSEGPDIAEEASC